VLVIFLEITILAVGAIQVRHKEQDKWHGKLAKILFPIWGFAYLSGEIFYLLNVRALKSLKKK
jgi:uncharacterized membrane protein YozB (DUF420 family)